MKIIVIILGIDPGTTRIGFGIIEASSGKLKCLHYGIIGHPGKDRLEVIRRVDESFSDLISAYRPEVAAIEKLFFFKNQKTVIEVSEMRGVILANLAKNRLMLKEFTPLQVKQAVSGYGRAGKGQVESMVRIILGLKSKVTPDDAADGLAIAICCANTIL